MVKHPGGNLGELVRNGRRPPVRERPLRTGVDQPVEPSQRQRRAHTRPRLGAVRATTSSTSPAASRRASIPHTAVTSPKRQMPGRGRDRHRIPGRDRRDDLVRRPQIALRDDPRLTVHPGRLDQVVVGFPADLLPRRRRHTLGNTQGASYCRSTARQSTQGSPSADRARTDSTDVQDYSNPETRARV